MKSQHVAAHPPMAAREPMHVLHPMPEQRALGNTALALLSAQGITWTTTFIGFLVIPRLLGVSDFGLFVFATTVGGFAMVLAGFGTANHIVKEIARDPSRTADIVAHATLLRVAKWLAIAAPGLYIARRLGTGDETMLVLTAVMVSVLVALVSEVASSALQGAHRVGRSQLSVAAIMLAGQFIAVGALLLGANVVGYTWLVSTLMPVASLVVLVLLLRKVLKGDVHVSYSTARNLTVAGTPFLAWNLAQYSYANASSVILTSLATSADTGVFMFAFRIAAIPAFIGTVVVATTYATLAESARTNPAFFRRLLTQSTRTTIVCIVPASVGIAMVVPQLAGLIGGDEYERAGPAIAILALQVPSMCVGTVIGTGLIALDKQRTWALIGWVAALSNILFTAIGVLVGPELGVSAVAGAAVANVIVDVGMVAAAWTLIGENIDRPAIIQVTARSLAACGAMAAAVFALLPVNIFLAIGAGAAVYAAAIFLTRAVTIGEVRRFVRERGGISHELSESPATGS